jgi:hypothetical protein
MTFSKTDVQEAVATIYAKLSKGHSDKRIMRSMGLDADTYKALKAAMYDVKTDEVRDTPEEHLYVKYMLDQNVNIKDLTKMINKFRKTGNPAAMVSAVRARSEILDKIIAKGQDFGLIKKTPDRKEIVAGLVVADLTNNELREGITGAIKQLDGLVKMYGSKTEFLELDVPVGLHHGPKLIEKKPSADGPPKKNAKNTKAKIFKGRRKKALPAPGTKRDKK